MRLEVQRQKKTNWEVVHITQSCPGLGEIVYQIIRMGDHFNLNILTVTLKINQSFCLVSAKKCSFGRSEIKPKI